MSDPRVYASDTVRAQQTAQAIAQALDVGVTVLERVQEMDIGNWRGRFYADLDTHTQELFGSDDRVAFPGGESTQDVVARLHSALAETAERGGTPIIVSHGLALQVWLCQLLGTPFQVAWQDKRYSHQNTAITELQQQGVNQKSVHWELVQLASTQHLDSPASTTQR